MAPAGPEKSWDTRPNWLQVLLSLSTHMGEGDPEGEGESPGSQVALGYREQRKLVTAGVREGVPSDVIALTPTPHVTYEHPTPSTEIL